MERKIGSAILKGSMLLAAMFLMEGSVYPVQAEEYSTFGTFSPDHFPAAAKEGETLYEMPQAKDVRSILSTEFC